MTERTTAIPDDSPDNTVWGILTILKEEADDAGAVFNPEQRNKRDISSQVVISLKVNGRTFRITLDWVRDECLERASLTVGHAYIEKEWTLKLKTDVAPHHSRQRFLWHLDRRKQEAPPFLPERILDGPLLRSLIREKLGVLQLP
jgi:hypothetical protein